jgi:hypothetical protein
VKVAGAKNKKRKSDRENAQRAQQKKGGRREVSRLACKLDSSA